MQSEADLIQNFELIRGLIYFWIYFEQDGLIHIARKTSNIKLFSGERKQSVLKSSKQILLKSIDDFIRKR